DPDYPAEYGDGYQTFSISAGQQHMDGATALKYVRSRKSTSDFDRAERQQQVIQAIKDKALSLGVLADPDDIKDILNAIDDNFDTNIEWDEMVHLAKIADQFDTENISSWVINDDPLSPGGFLYTPEREQYGGAFVLIPYDSDYSDIQKFADLVLLHPEVHASGTTYQVLNGTLSSGVASNTLYYMIRYGFDVVRYGNGANRDAPNTRFIPINALLSGQNGTTISEDPALQYLTEEFLPIGFILEEVPLEYTPVEWETDADVIIELGEDYVEWMNTNWDYFY
ncbi:MAG: LCP family protein, partial [Candidatus Peregrinibacteria bacterium]|nr:LCP family protein [Candidatus Peregrinibacteria bacterium]